MVSSAIDKRRAAAQPQPVDPSASQSALAERGWRLRNEDHAQAEAIAKRLVRTGGSPAAYGAILLAYLRLREWQFDVCMEHVLEAQRLLAGAAPSPWTARLYNQEGCCYINIGEFHQGYGCLQKQLGYALAYGFQEEESAALHDIGCYFVQTGEFQRAEEFFDRAEARNPRNLSIACFIAMNRSECAIGTGRLVDAVRIARQAVAIATANKLVRALSFAEAALGHALSATGDHMGAQFAFERASLVTGLSGEVDIETALLACEAMLNGGQDQEAIASLDSLADRITASGSLRDDMNRHRLLATAYKQARRFEEALDHNEQYHALHERLFNEDRERKVRMLDLVHRTDLLKREATLLTQQNESLNRHVGELSALNDHIKELSLRDPLTGLYNRRHLFQTAGEWFADAGREQRPVSVAMLDLDHFKSINDRFGHKIGDDVISRVARLLERHVRSGDIVARYGGEEFSILMDDMPILMAEQACERLRRIIVREAWSKLHPDLSVTVSIGVAGAAGCAAGEDLFILADQQLYEAKKGGRNRVVAADQSETQHTTQTALSM